MEIKRVFAKLVKDDDRLCCIFMSEVPVRSSRQVYGNVEEVISEMTAFLIVEFCSVYYGVVRNGQR